MPFSGAFSSGFSSGFAIASAVSADTTLPGILDLIDTTPQIRAISTTPAFLLVDTALAVHAIDTTPALTEVTA